MPTPSSAPSRTQAKPLPSLEDLDEWLNYDPETGVIRWRKAMRCGSIPAGVIAGGLRSDGYREISIHNVRYRAHRIAFKMHHRRDPVGEVDHRDTDRGNNRIGNLREASHVGNAQNEGIRKNNTSGVKGVCWDKKTGKWLVTLRFNGKKRFLGYFPTIEEASAAVQTARERLHGEFCNHG